MTLQLNHILNALNCAYQGSPEQISQAQQFLLQMIDSPNEYSKILINIMITPNIPEMTRIAAAIQFKYLLLNSEIFNQLSIENIINIIIKTPPLVQVQLQAILSRVVNKYLLLEPEQGIQVLLSIVTKCCNSDVNHIFVGIEIIRFIYKSDCKIFPGIGDKDMLASKYIIPLFSVLVNLGISMLNPFLLHYLLLTANFLLNYSDLQPLSNWVNLIIAILNQEADLSKNNSGIDKDALKFATGIIELKQQLLEPRMATQMFIAIVNRIKRNQMSYKGICFSFRYIHQFIGFNSYVADLLSVNQSNIFLDFVTNILFNVFVLNQNVIQQIDEDLFNFLLLRHNMDSSEMFETPVSGSIHVLKRICKEKYFLNEIVQFSLFQINQNINNLNEYGKLYGAAHFASIIAPFVDSSFQQIVIQNLFSATQKKEENQKLTIFRMTSFFLFLSNIKINNLDLFLLCLNNLTNETLPSIIHYFCAISIPNFFAFFKIEEVAAKIQSSLNLSIFIKKILELNSKYPTNRISSSIKSIFQYFMPFLEPISIEVVQELLTIYCQLVNEENENKSEIGSSIIRLSNMMKCKEKSIEFYSNSLQIIMKLLYEAESANYYDMLSIMNNIVCDSVSGINQANENISIFNNLLIQISGFLFNMIDNSLDSTIFPLITDILKYISIYSIHVFQNNSITFISQPISKILQNFLNKFVNRESCEIDDVPLLISSINKLSQILFLVLKNQESFPYFLQAFTKINDSSFADSFAAIATLAPIPTFSNELNFRICLNFASPAAFLLCFEFIVRNMNQMPNYIVSEQQEIQKMISTNLEKLLSEINQVNQNNDIVDLISDDDEDEIILNDDEIDFDQDRFSVSCNKEDQDIFNFQALIAFYQM